MSFVQEFGQLVAHLEGTKLPVQLCIQACIFRHFEQIESAVSGKNKRLCNLYEGVKGFNDKLWLFKTHVESGNFFAFDIHQRTLQRR